MTLRPLRVGFHGAGFISLAHRWLLAHSGVAHELVAVHDPDAGRAARFAEQTGAAVVGEAELVAATDVVFVCTWTSEHPRLVAAAAAAGRAVFCEKPLAVDAAGADRMIADVAEAPRSSTRSASSCATCPATCWLATCSPTSGPGG